MTPEAVIDRYLETVVQDPLDPTRLALLLGADADLLGRWLRLLGCAAVPRELTAALAAFDAQAFEELALAQAVAELTETTSTQLGLEQWRAALTRSFVAEAMAEALQLPEPQTIRWRVLLACSGVDVPADPELSELLAFRGARREFLEDASMIHRLLAAVDGRGAHDSQDAQDAACELLGLAPERYRTLVAAGHSRCGELLSQLGLAEPREPGLRLRVSLLGRLLDQLPAADPGHRRLAETHALLCRGLFGTVPQLLLVGACGERLVAVGGQGPDIALLSATSRVAGSARLTERAELHDRTDQSVADRQILRRLGTAHAVCVPLVRTGSSEPLGVLVYAVDTEDDHEPVMRLYADELTRRLVRRRGRNPAEQGRLERYRQREEKRLRELVHEASNPLSVVHNYLHILEVRLQHEPAVIEQVRMIGDELRRAGELLAQARNLSELEEVAQAEPEIELTEVDLNALVRRAVELHLGYAGEHAVALSARLVAGELPVTSDEPRLAQILSNLLRNAIEAARGASVTVRTLGGAYREGREGALLVVADEGPGLSREVISRLAQPKESSKGGAHAGLGLHIVHRLAAELKGSIDVRTAAGAGTEFSVFLPLVPA